MTNLILTIELVPSTSWYANMRKVLSQSDWDILRKSVYAEYGHKCGICGASGRLNCHEVWEYDDEKHTQTLNSFIALCDLCHHVKHIGLAKILADEGKLRIDDVVAHFCEVNGCSYADFVGYEKTVWSKWEERSKCDWGVHLGEYAELAGRQEDASANEIFSVVGHPFDLFSDRQVAEVLFTELALSGDKVGRISDSVLRGVSHPVAVLIADYRKEHKND